jgi:hypothetical protein
MTSFVEKIVAVHDHLDAAGVQHAYGGAIALAYHVENPRATADIDLNIAAPPGAARQVFGALPDPVTWTPADVRQVERAGQTRLFWGRTPVDLFFPQHELHTMVATRTERVPFAASIIPILSATDLTIFKALFDRPKDWVDIAEMLAYGRVDIVEVRTWLSRLLGADDPRVARLEALG